MAQPHPYPDGTDRDADPEPNDGQPWKAVLGIVVAAIVIIVVVYLHLAGIVGQGAH